VIRNSSTSCAGICVSKVIWGFKPMMNLAEYRRSATQLADFLPWAALVDEGIVLNKDGSFQRTAKFRGRISIPPCRRSSSASPAG
jgi:hypothetical protein